MVVQRNDKIMNVSEKRSSEALTIKGKNVMYKG